ncbi:hypothetical protein [Jeotgalibacillus aurantiacus]|uniref:hypothetical protein n=1 Tax=Jeotgalibacillus aurantiacus TaxID=2763266 RepID=UPI001D0AB256|nr:hypothetical protein [Jeotgalibacillus aurantiacus]
MKKKRKPKRKVQPLTTSISDLLPVETVAKLRGIAVAEKRQNRKKAGEGTL